MSSKAITFVEVRFVLRRTYRFVARLVINVHKGAVDLRQFLELVLQGLRAVECKKSEGKYSAPAR